eukprot:TRINITY_DN8701_c0_g1_i1.p1 TRINITY_DN8701_c0_g1~~TRINITY_DN8701_c0_g1_i1.p1  ORF type:complete len:270 (-),score=59.21 TRINITY_DN8701_c0_g1_i1:146-955(-)
MEMDGRIEKKDDLVPDIEDSDVVGRVHSWHTGAAVDGPGMRFLIFLQGCRHRCVFCCNPDTWAPKTDKTEYWTPKDMAARIRRYLPYLKSKKNGVTISGGEPMLQASFCSEVFKECHKMGITTALDTTGDGTKEGRDLVLPYLDYCLLCVKSVNPFTYKKITKSKIDNMLSFVRDIGERKIKTYIRYVIVPGMTDSDEEVDALADFCQKFSEEYGCLEAVELLPYHVLGKHKWEEMGIPYSLDGVAPPPPERVEAIRERLRARDLPLLG